MGVQKKMDAGVIRFPVVVSNIENLAGLDMVIGYDEEMWKFVRLAKTTLSAAFLMSHNAKTPGTVRVVMASPSGVAIERGPVIVMDFKYLGDGGTALPPFVQEVEGMDAHLESIPVNFKDVQ